jgi:hypothetical protein
MLDGKETYSFFGALMRTDQELLALAKETSDKTSASFRADTKRDNAVFTVYNIGYFCLGDGRVIRFDEMGDAYFAEE